MLVSTNIKCDIGNTEGSLCDRIQLGDVKVPLIFIRPN